MKSVFPHGDWLLVYLSLLYHKILSAIQSFVCAQRAGGLDNGDGRRLITTTASVGGGRSRLVGPVAAGPSARAHRYPTPLSHGQTRLCIVSHAGGPKRSRCHHCYNKKVVSFNIHPKKKRMAPGATAESMFVDKEKVLSSNMRSAKVGRPRRMVNQFAPLLIALVGLPARGKSQLAHRLARHLNWNGESTKVYDCSEYRRRHMDMYASHDIFRSDNQQGTAIRQQSAREAVQDAVLWLKEGNCVAIFDGTNIKKHQRHELQEYCINDLGFRILFLECVCEDQNLLERNIIEILRYSADYKTMTEEEAVEDLNQKMQHYMRQYEPIDPTDEDISFVRVENGGETVTAHKVNGQKESGILGYLSGMKAMPQTLYFSRHGESEYNVLGRIGGDANLSPRGFQYAHALSKHMNELVSEEHLEVWTSELQRTKQTAQDIMAPKQAIRALNELDAGICEGLTYEEMQQKFPQEFAWRDQDKLRYRYPWGESYIDIMTRLRPVLSALEDSDNVLIVGHQAVLRCVLGYFLDAKLDELPYMNVPLHTIVKLTSEGYNYRAEMIKLPVECVDTQRHQPNNCSISRSTDEALKTVPSHYDTLPSSLWQTSGGSAPR